MTPADAPAVAEKVPLVRGVFGAAVAEEEHMPVLRESGRWWVRSAVEAVTGAVGSVLLDVECDPLDLDGEQGDWDAVLLVILRVTCGVDLWSIICER